MAPKLTRDDVRRVATLARLELAESEIDQFTAELGAILEYAGAIQRIDTTGVAPTFQMPDVPSVQRDDEPVPSLDRREILERAPDADAPAGLFKVPKVL